MLLDVSYAGEVSGMAMRIDSRLRRDQLLGLGTMTRDDRKKRHRRDDGSSRDRPSVRTSRIDRARAAADAHAAGCHDAIGLPSGYVT